MGGSAATQLARSHGPGQDANREAVPRRLHRRGHLQAAACPVSWGRARGDDRRKNWLQIAHAPAGPLTRSRQEAEDSSMATHEAQSMACACFTIGCRALEHGDTTHA